MDRCYSLKFSTSLWQWIVCQIVFEWKVPPGREIQEVNTISSCACLHIAILPFLLSEMMCECAFVGKLVMQLYYMTAHMVVKKAPTFSLGNVMWIQDSMGSLLLCATSCFSHPSGQWVVGIKRGNTKASLQEVNRLEIHILLCYFTDWLLFT